MNEKQRLLNRLKNAGCKAETLGPRALLARNLVTQVLRGAAIAWVMATQTGCSYFTDERTTAVELPGGEMLEIMDTSGMKLSSVHEILSAKLQQHNVDLSPSTSAAEGIAPDGDPNEGLMTVDIEVIARTMSDEQVFNGSRAWPLPKIKTCLIYQNRITSESISDLHDAINSDDDAVLESLSPFDASRTLSHHQQIAKAWMNNAARKDDAMHTYMHELSHCYLNSRIAASEADSPAIQRMRDHQDEIDTAALKLHDEWGVSTLMLMRTAELQLNESIADVFGILASSGRRGAKAIRNTAERLLAQRDLERLYSSNHDSTAVLSVIIEQADELAEKMSGNDVFAAPPAYDPANNRIFNVQLKSDAMLRVSDMAIHFVLDHLPALEKRMGQYVPDDVTIEGKTPDADAVESAWMKRRNVFEKTRVKEVAAIERIAKAMAVRADENDAGIGL